MRVSKGLLKLLPANVSDVVLRIKLDRADDRFDREHSTDWDYECIKKNCTPERMAKSLGYFQSTRGFGLSMAPNGGRKHYEFSHEYKPSVVPWWFERHAQGCGLIKRDLAFDKVVDSFHAAVYGGHLKNLVSLHINVEMDSRALVLLIDSNRSTLKSITLDGTEIVPKRERMSGKHARDVVKAIQCCSNLQCLDVVDWFHEDEDEVLALLPSIVPDIVLRGSLDNVGDQFSSEKIPVERTMELLGYSHSTKGFDLCMTRNVAYMITNAVRGQSDSVPFSGGGGGALSGWRRGWPSLQHRKYAFEQVINSFHDAIYNRGFKNLASIYIDVAVCSRGLKMLFDSNRNTLKSITLDGTMFLECDRQGEYAAFVTTHRVESHHVWLGTPQPVEMVQETDCDIDWRGFLFTVTTDVSKRLHWIITISLQLFQRPLLIRSVEEMFRTSISACVGPLYGTM